MKRGWNKLIDPFCYLSGYILIYGPDRWNIYFRDRASLGLSDITIWENYCPNLLIPWNPCISLKITYPTIRLPALGQGAEIRQHFLSRCQVLIQLQNYLRWVSNLTLIHQSVPWILVGQNLDKKEKRHKRNRNQFINLNDVLKFTAPSNTSNKPSATSSCSGWGYNETDENGHEI